MTLIKIFWDEDNKKFIALGQIISPVPIGEPVLINKNIDREIGPNLYAELMVSAYDSHTPEGANAYAETRQSTEYPITSVQYYRINKYG